MSGLPAAMSRQSILVLTVGMNQVCFFLPVHRPQVLARTRVFTSNQYLGEITVGAEALPKPKSRRQDTPVLVHASDI